MNILYELLAAAGILFALSMLFICIGLLKNPKVKKGEVEEAQVYSGMPPENARTFAGSDIHKEDAEADNSEPNADEAAEDYEDEDVAEAEEVDAENPEGDDDAPGEADDGESEAETAEKDGIPVSVTVIDTDDTYELSVSDEVLIGRNPKCDVVVPRPVVSSVHCILIKDNNKLMVEDNNSTNGTLLNGKPLKHVVELKNNDMLTLGDQRIRVNF